MQRIACPSNSFTGGAGTVHARRSVHFSLDVDSAGQGGDSALHSSHEVVVVVQVSRGGRYL